MAYNLLLVEDEPGIREGLTSYLQLKGYRVIAAASCAEGLRRITAGEFDLVITDWHLGDGLGESIAKASQCPVLVISGVTERVEIEDHSGCIEVMRKPVMPPDLVDKIEAMLCPVPELKPGSELSVELDLPIDARDRVELFRTLVRSRHEVNDQSISVLDDGTFVTVQALLAHDDEPLQKVVEKIGGDVRCLDRGGRPLLELRFFKSGQRQASDQLIGPLDSWPDGQATIAVDFFDTDGCPPTLFVELVDKVEAARQSGRSAYFLNVPTHLRLHLELLGKAHAMPMREMAGPALPAILAELWR